MTLLPPPPGEGHDADRARMLERILASHSRAIRRIASAYAGATDEAEDLQQEILLRIWRSIPSFRGEAALGTWAFRVALNTALTWRRRARAAPGERATTVEPATQGVPRDASAILAEFMATLSALDRSLLLLYAEGLSASEAADVVGLSPNAVAVRLSRIKRRFTRDHLEP